MPPRKMKVVSLAELEQGPPADDPVSSPEPPEPPAEPVQPVAPPVIPEPAKVKVKKAPKTPKAPPPSPVIDVQAEIAKGVKAQLAAESAKQKLDDARIRKLLESKFNEMQETKQKRVNVRAPIAAGSDHVARALRVEQKLKKISKIPVAKAPVAEYSSSPEPQPRYNPYAHILRR